MAQVQIFEKFKIFTRTFGYKQCTLFIISTVLPQILAVTHSLSFGNGNSGLFHDLIFVEV